LNSGRGNRRLANAFAELGIASSLNQRAQKRSEERLIAVRANSAAGAARPVIVVAIRILPLARQFKLTDRVQ
jgi:hypothetical protein